MQAVKIHIKIKHIPVILFSAHSSAVANINEYGADNFIAKPFDVNDLLAKVNNQIPVKV